MPRRISPLMEENFQTAGTQTMGRESPPRRLRYRMDVCASRLPNDRRREPLVGPRSVSSSWRRAPASTGIRSERRPNAIHSLWRSARVMVRVSYLLPFSLGEIAPGMGSFSSFGTPFLLTSTFSVRSSNTPSPFTLWQVKQLPR